ncbi:MAG: carbohydrate kinase family protein [bacterium]
MVRLKKHDIVTFGNAFRDVFMYDTDFQVVKSSKFITGQAIGLELGSKKEITNIAFDTGGGATNSAVTFSRLGYKTAFVSRLGKNDIRSKEILRRLELEKVDTSLVSHDDKKEAGYTVILLTRKGERTAMVHRGVSSDMSIKNIPINKIHAKWFYITSLGGDIKTLSYIIDYAKKNNISVALNPGMSELTTNKNKLKSILKDTSILFLNDQEAGVLTGLMNKQDRILLKNICCYLPGIVVITSGKRGAFVCDNKKHYHSNIHSVKVIDATGAGDAFGSGFLAAYIKTGNIKYSLQVGTENSESVIQHIGAKQGIIRRFPKKSSIKVTSQKTAY